MILNKDKMLGNNISNNNRKEDKPISMKRGVRTAMVWMLLVSISLCLAACGNKETQEPEPVEEVQEEVVEETKPAYDDLVDPIGTGKSNGIRRYRTFTPDWKGLWKECEDIIGWINCPGTKMNYPIAQGTDNAYYLETSYQGVYDGAGTPFVDYRCEKPFKGFLTVLYGHRQRDGSMFKHLSYYFYPDGEDFYDDYHTYEIYTPDRNYELQVFAWARVSETDGYTYDFELCNEKETKEQKQAYLDYVYSINQAKNPKYTVTTDDDIVLMSICTAELDTDREVVWGKLVPLK